MPRRGVRARIWGVSRSPEARPHLDKHDRPTLDRPTTREVGGFLAAIFALVLFLGVGDRQVGAATRSPQAIPGIGAWRIGTHDLDLSARTQRLGRYSAVVLSPWKAAWGPLIRGSRKTPGRLRGRTRRTKVSMYTNAVDISR